MPKDPQDPFAEIAKPVTSNDPFADIAKPVEAPVERGVVSGVIRGAKNLYHMPGQLWDSLTKAPETDEEKMISENGIASVHGHVPGSIALPFWRIVGKPMEDAEDKADKYEQAAKSEKDPEVKKQLLDAAGAWRTGAKVPLVGPVAANLAERAAYGEQGPKVVGPSGKGGWENENQDVTGALGEAGTYVAAPKAAEDVLKAGVGVTKAGIGVVKSGVEALPKAVDTVRDITPKQAGQVVGGVAGGVAGHGNVALSPVGAFYGAKGAGRLVESILGKERANQPLIARTPPPSGPGAPLPEVPDPALVQAQPLAQGGTPVTSPSDALGSLPVEQQIPGVNVRPSLERITPEPVYPGAPLPGDLAKASGIAEGGKPITSPSDALGQIPVPKSISELPAQAVSQAVSQLGSKATIQSITDLANQIEQGLGGKGLEPNVPIGQQGGIITPQQSSPGAVQVKTNIRSAQGLEAGGKPYLPSGGNASELPEPQPRPAPPPRESTSIKAFRYDPDAKEMHVTWKGGDSPITYVYGEVTPAQSEMFHAAESKGMAAKSIKDNNVLVAKIINGKRIEVKPAKPVISDEDLISQDEWDAGHELETGVEGSRKR